MKRSFSRVAIVNRGEAALRFIHAALELNREGERLHTVALYTAPDRHSLFVREADEAWDLGPAAVETPDGRRKIAYADLGRLEEALVATRAEAAWPGWGFVAEDPGFAELCERLGVTFIGPSPAAMRALGDKIAGKRLAEGLGIPVVPWAGGPVAGEAEAARQAAELGFPVMVKATAGIGGRAVREAETPGVLPGALKAARAAAWKWSGQATVFLERRLDGARHLDVQVVSDAWGGVWALPAREASIQRRHQKLVAESPVPRLPPAREAAMRKAAARLVQAAGYVGAAGVEFLYDPVSEDFWFLEANTRLEVEHGVSEVTIGLDLVKLQIHVARGGRLPGEPPSAVGHAIEARLCAEDAEAGFAPAPGTVARLRLPGGPGLRVDAGVAEGDLVPAEFDSMIAKIIANGRDREEALGRLARALAQTAVILRGGATNKAFLLDLLDREEVRAGRLDVGFLDRLVARGEQSSRRHAELALVRAAIEAYEAEGDGEKARFLSTAVRGRPEVRPEASRSVELRQGGQVYSVVVRRTAVDRYRVEEDGRRVEVGVERLGSPLRERRLQTSEWRLQCGGSTWRVLSLVQGRTHLVEVEGVPHTFTRESQGPVVAPAPAIVVSVAVRPGDEVAAGQPLVVLEAMKMETSVDAPFPGQVREVRVVPNVQVGPGDPLVVLDPEPRRAALPRERRLHLDALGGAAAGPPAGLRQALEELRGLMLGFDAEAGGLREPLSRPIERSAGEPFARGAAGVLDIFADICSLFRRQGGADEEWEDGNGFGVEEYLFTYLRKLDHKGAGLPAPFLTKLRRALRHYGVLDLARSPELEESLYRICKAHQREEHLAAPVSLLLERLREGEAASLAAVPDLPALLDRVIAATQSRYPAVNDLAREVRFRLVERPLLQRVRAVAFAAAEGDLLALAGGPAPGERAALLERLVQCPQPLAGLLAERYEAASRTAQEAILEVLLRRFYRIRALDEIRVETVEGHPFAVASYEREGRRRRALLTHAGDSSLSTALARMGRLAAPTPPDRELVGDVFLWRPGGAGEVEANATEIREILEGAALPRSFRRLVVAVGGPGSMHHFTFRPAQGGGYAEETFFRDAHPMMAKRLELHRLQHFDLERLASVEDVYLFRAVAKGNPRDERLFAVAEVRDLTPVRDAAGHVVQLPELERMLLEALGAMRRVQTRRPPGQRLHGNRVILHVWPVLDVSDDDLHAFVARYAPTTEGLGLEGVTIHGRVPAEGGEARDVAVFLSKPPGRPIVVRRAAPDDAPIAPLSEYEQKVVRLAQRGLVYPYELVRMLAPGPEERGGQFPPGEFVEHDLDGDGRLVPVDRPFGQNRANVIAGVIRNFTARHPEGMARVLLLGDPSRELGSLAEPECRRIAAALELAREMRCPVDWLALSAGAKIAKDSGTENMDWIALVLRRIVEFTQGGGEINVVVNGINVGAQPYWNAEATMLMHTRGILVMMPDSAMVLTGKRALDFSGGVSAEDNQGIGGYERVMGPNGQAQYFARDVGEACQILFRHHEHAYFAPGERFPRRARTEDPADRDVCAFAYERCDEHGFAAVGDVLTDSGNPGRKRPFDVRNVMRSVVDQDHPPLERWAAWRDAETVVVWDAHLGGWPVCVLGIESEPQARFGIPPADGPEQWTGGTLFPQSSRKAARAINAASGSRPLVVLANLTGFDGSPESLRQWQLEYGAEIGRAVVNFRGPIVFCVVSRYHGGAFVVFSNALHDNLSVIALEGTYASVIGGAPAAAVVFSREVDTRTAADPRVQEVEAALASATGHEKVRLRARLREVTRAVQSEKLGQVADEYDAVHSVERARRVGSVHEIIPASRLRPHLIEAVEKGIARERERVETPARA
ncbi:MAG TPA: carboxyl transferase domain-containing protein [Vicinamibacteria bacterium]|nr:carboxyl transferase domain-containing protein [Vicinamibacteria bacterium]